MKVNIPLKVFNTILSVSYKKKLVCLIIGTMSIAIIKIMGDLINKVIIEKRSCNTRKERENLLEKELIKEEKEIRTKLKKEFFEEREVFCMLEKNALNIDKQTHAEKCFKKLLRQKIFRSKPFKQALDDINLKTLKPRLVSGTKAEGIPIGRYRNFDNEVHPFQEEYDSLSEDVKRKLAKENSLFLSGNLSKEAKIELMKNSDSFIGLARSQERNNDTLIDRISNVLFKVFKGKEKPRFIASWGFGFSEIVLDSVNGVFYKPSKSHHIETTAAMVRYYLEELKIDNIILPKREFWNSRESNVLDEDAQFRPGDKSSRTTTLVLEESIDNLITHDLSILTNMYEELPAELFNDIIINFTRISCFLDIGDLASKQLEYGGRSRIDLIKNSGRYIVKTTYNNDNGFKQTSACRFDNLQIQCTKNSDGENCYKFVLVDLDITRKPDHSTVETLLRMFPKHQQLIVDTIQKTNPVLFEGYDPEGKIRSDKIISKKHIISTRNELISNYKDNKGKLFVEDKLRR